MPSAEYTLLVNGNYTTALQTGLTNLLPLGLVWVFIGLLIFSVIYMKTKSYGVSGMIFVVYSALVIGYNVIPVAIQPFMALLVGLLLAVMLIKVIK